MTSHWIIAWRFADEEWSPKSDVFYCTEGEAQAHMDLSRQMAAKRGAQVEYKLVKFNAEEA